MRQIITVKYMKYIYTYTVYIYIYIYMIFLNFRRKSMTKLGDVVELRAIDGKILFYIQKLKKFSNLLLHCAKNIV